jgi:flavin-dependent dehydrogenase
MIENRKYDAIVMGGGPAGSCCASILARAGKRVLILEKERFPRHHIGESLIPMTYWSLKRMGALDKVRSAGFTKKFSVQFASASGKPSKPFYFFETNHHESSVTWQVARGEFDKLLLDHARACGAEVMEGTPVRDVLFEGDRAVGVEAALADGANGRAQGERARFFAPAVVDATGLNALLAGKLGLRVRDPNLRKAAVYGYFRKAMRDVGVDAGATLVLKTVRGRGWFWFIPLADDLTSVGVVADPDYLFAPERGRDYEKILTEEIARCPAVAERLSRAERADDKVYTIADYCFRTRRCSGPGWVLIGDAFGFLDPIYSTGVFIALKSGEMAADCILEAHAHDDFSGERLGAFGPRLSRGVESFRKLVYAFYTEGFSFGAFMRAHPHFRTNLIDLLVGDVLKEGVDAIFGPMSQEIEIPPPLFGAAPEPSNPQSTKSEARL